MATKSKPRQGGKTPVLCELISGLRRKTKMSQQNLAALLEISAMSLSRYENGLEPKSRRILSRLAAVAADAGLNVEEKVFRDAALALPGGSSRFEPSIMMPTYSPLEWRLMQASRIALSYFPDVARDIEQAAGPALDLVDEILADAALGEGRPTAQFYSNLETQLNERAARKLFKDHFTKEGKLK
jgi:transcriptional regulator with XRE-family HTH domain